MLDRVRMWLRARGLGERRWIADMSEREEHRLAVRGRLARPGPGDAADTDADDDANEKTDDPPGDAAPGDAAPGDAAPGDAAPSDAAPSDREETAPGA